jgi:hypothetical protein
MLHGCCRMLTSVAAALACVGYCAACCMRGRRMLYVCADVCCVSPLLPKSIRWCDLQTYMYTYTACILLLLSQLPYTTTLSHVTPLSLSLSSHTRHTHTQPLTRPRDGWHTLGARWKIKKVSSEHTNECRSVISLRKKLISTG